MAQYLIQVELDMRPSVVPYVDEHLVMSGYGFCKAIFGKDCSKTYALPEGTYLGESPAEPFILVQKLQFLIHRATGKRVQVTVTPVDVVSPADLLEESDPCHSSLVERLSR